MKEALLFSNASLELLFQAEKKKKKKGQQEIEEFCLK